MAAADSRSSKMPHGTWQWPRTAPATARSGTRRSAVDERSSVAAIIVAGIRHARDAEEPAGLVRALLTIDPTARTARVRERHIPMRETMCRTCICIYARTALRWPCVRDAALSALPRHLSELG